MSLSMGGSGACATPGVAEGSELNPYGDAGGGSWWIAVLVGLALGIAGDAWWAPRSRGCTELMWAAIASAVLVIGLVVRRVGTWPGERWSGWLNDLGLRYLSMSCTWWPNCWTWMIVGGVWLGLGGGWHHFRVTRVAGDDIVRSAPPWRTPVALRGEVVSAVQRVPGSPAEPLRGWATEPRTRFVCRLTGLRDGRQWRPTSGDVDVVCQGTRDDLWPGDRVQILGQLSRLSGPMNPGQRDALGAGRLRGRPCVVFVAEPACVELERSVRPWRLTLARWRQWADRVLAAELGEDRRGLASALLLGLRHGLTADRIDPFRTTGLMHLLSLSGMHVTVLVGAAWLAWRAGWAGQRWVAGAVWWLSLLYALMTDAQAPILRATLLVQLVCWGVWIRRPVDHRHGLVVAGIGVLIWDPRYLFQVGTWLSFLAVYVLGDAAVWRWGERRSGGEGVGGEGVGGERVDPLERLEHRSRPAIGRLCERGWRGVGRAAWTSLMVWLITLPLVAHAYHVVSPWTPLLNLLIALPVSLAMFGGLSVLIAAAWVPLWSAGGAAVCSVGLDLMMGLLQWAERWPWAVGWVAGPTAWGVAWFYVCLASARWLGARGSRYWLAMWLVAVVGLAAITGWERRSRSVGGEGGEASVRLECWILAVGHGNCTLLRFPGGRSVLVDAGTQGDPRWGVDMISEVLWYLGIERLDTIVVSHADVDHFNLVPGLLGRFAVGRVVVPPELFRGAAVSGRPESSPAVACLARSLVERGLEPCIVSDGDRLAWDADVEVRVVHPSWPVSSLASGGSGSGELLRVGSDNARSLVLSVRSAGRGILLPADLEPPGLEEVMARVAGSWDVVVMPHHGSEHSRPVEVARWASAKWTVISGDRDDVSGWAELAESGWGTSTLHTAFHGAVRVVIGRRGGMDVESWRTASVDELWGLTSARIHQVLQQGSEAGD
ncbi:MAG: ComEC/Rec2 family competence protein [Pirellulales bacterium]